MKKLTLLLLLIPNLVMGEWFEFSQNVYTNLSTMDLVNNNVRLKSYVNVPQGNSISFFYEFNCNEKAYRSLNTVFYSMPDLQGTSESINRGKEWQYSEKTSIIGKMLDDHCAPFLREGMIK